MTESNLWGVEKWGFMSESIFIQVLIEFLCQYNKVKLVILELILSNFVLQIEKVFQLLY